MRSISLPRADKFKDFANRYEDISVVIGWIVHLLHTFACIFDTPLRYQFKVLGSTSSIIDHIKVVDERTMISREFPLYLKSAKCSKTEWDRFLYGIFLLNKNLVQLRYELGKNTFDLRPILQNVAEIMALGKDSHSLQDIVNALPTTISLTLPPKSISSSCSISMKDTISASLPHPSKNVMKGEQSDINERVDGYRIEIDNKFDARGGLKSHIVLKDSPNQRQYNNDCGLSKDDSFANFDKLKSVGSHVDDLVASVQNTRSFSASSSSSYDTIETDRMSDDITDTTDNQSNIENKTNSHNLTKIVRNVAKDKHMNDIDINAPIEKYVNSTPKPASNPFEDHIPDDGKKDIETVINDGEQLNEQNLNSLFWGDVTSRTSALSKPSSFQRKRTNH